MKEHQETSTLKQMKTLVGLLVAVLLAAVSQAANIIVQGFATGPIPVLVGGESVNAGVAYGTVNGAGWVGFCLDPQKPLYIGVSYTMHAEDPSDTLTPAEVNAIGYVLSLHPTGDAWEGAARQVAVWEAVGWPVEPGALKDAADAILVSAVVGTVDWQLLHDVEVDTQRLTMVPEPARASLFTASALVLLVLGLALLRRKSNSTIFLGLSFLACGVIAFCFIAFCH